MKYKLKALFISLLILFSPLVMGWVEVGPNYIEQYGITWTFDKDISLDGAGDTYQWGTFVNGDYWVVGPVAIIGIDPPSTEIDGRTMNGSMINPPADDRQSYDSSAPSYTASLNVVLGVDEANPLALPANSSLVSSISTASSSGKTQVQAAAILTVVQAAPPLNAFRPSYCGTDKSTVFVEADLDYTKLAQLTPVDGTPALALAEPWFERPWIDHKSGDVGDQIHPLDNMPDYGREMVYRTARAALLLNLNYTNEVKRLLLVRYIQLGIDNFGVIQAGGITNWMNNGGHGSSRKLPILFAGLLLNDQAMKAIGLKSGSYPHLSDYIHFGEDDQVFYVAQTDVDLTNGLTWDPDDRFGNVPAPYTEADLGIPEWGIRHIDWSNRSDKSWGAIYRAMVGPGIIAQTLAAHIMGINDLWNHDALFDYADRYMSIISEFPEDSTWRVGTNGLDRNKTGPRFVWNMWHTYRANYGHVWPDGASKPDPELEDDAANDIPDKTLLRISNNIIKSGGNSAVTINCDVTEAGKLTLKIYDSKGREIITLWNKHEEPGTVPVTWTGLDSSGGKVGSGIYLIHMECGSYKETKKIAIIK